MTENWAAAPYLSDAAARQLLAFVTVHFPSVTQVLVTRERIGHDSSLSPPSPGSKHIDDVASREQSTDSSPLPTGISEDDNCAERSSISGRLPES